MLLTSKYVVPVTAPYIEDGAVLVKDGKIADIGTAEELKARYPEEEVKDYGLAALSPGFVNMHTHLRYTALRGLFEDLSYADWRVALYSCQPFFALADWDMSAKLGVLESIASGITTVADLTSSDSSLKAISEAGLRGRVYREVRTSQAKDVDEYMQDAISDLENWRSSYASSRISFGIGAGSTYATHPKVYKEVAKYANETGTPVTMHLAGSQEEDDFLRYGSSPFSVHANANEKSVLNVERPVWLPAGVSAVRYVYNWDILEVPNIYIVHGVHVDDDDIDILKRCGVSVAHCPRINAKLGMGSAPIQKYLEAGITVGLGTDSSAAVDTADMVDEMRVGLMIARANRDPKKPIIASEKMLRMATIDAAHALGMDSEIGSLEVGKRADIIAIDLHNSHQNPTTNPASAIIYTANQDNVMMTMVDGQILYDNFVHISGLKRDEIVEAAREIRQHIRAYMNDEEIHRKVNERFMQETKTRVKR